MLDQYTVLIFLMVSLPPRVIRGTIWLLFTAHCTSSTQHWARRSPDMKINFPHVLTKFSLALNILTSQLVKCCHFTEKIKVTTLSLYFYLVSFANPNLKVHNLIKSYIGKIFLFSRCQSLSKHPPPILSSCHYHNRFPTNFMSGAPRLSSPQLLFPAY